MIKRLKYHEIDFEKYRKCLENSEQYKYSAAKIFLDITSQKQWELLIMNDYEAVMPVPFVIKFGIKVVLHPRLCQQLGVFSNKDDKKVNDLFLKFLIKNYNVFYYAFNDKNNFTENLQKRNNYLIFPNSYENVRKKYSPKRKRKLRISEEIKDVYSIEEIDFEASLNFMKNNMIGHKTIDDKRKYIEIFQNLYNKNLIKFSAFKVNNEIYNLIALYVENKTVVLLGTFNKKETIKFSGASILIDKEIENFIPSKIFDFEGSDIPNIKEFFRGFRPTEAPYSYISKSKKQLILDLLRFRK